MSNIKKFKHIGFWAREFRLPLFWLSDSNLKVFSDKTLSVYKNSIIHLYYLEDKSSIGSRKMFDYFSKRQNLSKYEKQCNKISEIMKKFGEKHLKEKVRTLSDEEMNTRFKEVFRVINLFADIYTKTEPIYLVKLDEQENKFKKTIKHLGELRFKLRKEGEVLFYILLGILVKELGRRNSIKVADLFFYAYDELLDLIISKKKVKGETLKARSKGYVLISSKRDYHIYVGKNFQQIYKDLVSVAGTAKTIKGKVAMKGKVRGRVRLILHNKRNILKDVMSFRKGEILVTEMTRPDTVLACKKAAAIVTDEGGITSHAAIISRELKIPCIIGTHNATQILKTGYLIEVDAENGVVKILKK
jgi:phosphohistidine swiveling domain-containing protein